jgi:hypothetical protein
MKINPIHWHSNREVEFCPKHFVKCNAELTKEAKFWVYENLTGRYHIGINDALFDPDIIYFEDPQEATLFELRWS